MNAEALALCHSVLLLQAVQNGEWVLPKQIFLYKIFVGDGHFHDSHLLLLSAILYHFSKTTRCPTPVPELIKID